MTSGNLTSSLFFRNKNICYNEDKSKEMVIMTEVKRNYKLFMDYLMQYGKAPLLAPLVIIAKHYDGKERIEKYKLYIDEICNSGKIDPSEIYKMYRKEED
jgi:hypothetical protein